HDLGLAEARGPAADRGDTVARSDGRTVRPLEAVRQSEPMREPVVVAFVALDHLRLRLELHIDREQRVVDEVTVGRADGRGGPDGVEDLEGGVRRDFYYRLGIRGVSAARAEAQDRGHGEEPRRAGPRSDQASP